MEQQKILTSSKDKIKAIRGLKIIKQKRQLSQYNLYVRAEMEKLAGEQDVQNKMKIISNKWNKMKEDKIVD